MWQCGPIWKERLLSLRKHRPGLSSGPKANEKCPYKRQQRRRHGEGHVKTEAEIGVMQPQVKGSGKEIRLCLSRKLKLQAEGRQMCQQWSLPPLFSTHQWAQKEQHAMTLLGIKNREPALKYLFLWTRRGHRKRPGGSGQRALWQTSKCDGLFSLAQPHANVSHATSAGSQTLPRCPSPSPSWACRGRSRVHLIREAFKVRPPPPPLPLTRARCLTPLLWSVLLWLWWAHRPSQRHGAWSLEQSTEQSWTQ